VMLTDLNCCLGMLSVQPAFVWGERLSEGIAVIITAACYEALLFRNPTKMP
jgi:hypothetical protein